MGINSDWSFEEDFSRRTAGLLLECYDGSVSLEEFRHQFTSNLRGTLRALGKGHLREARLALYHARDWFRTAQRFHRFYSVPNHRFHQKFVGSRNDSRYASVPDILAGLPPQPSGATPSVFVKIDIEGAEYEILKPLLQRGSSFTGMVVEFHGLDRQWKEFVDVSHELARHMAIAHIHGNNFDDCVRGTRVPKVLEVSYINRALLNGNPEPSTTRYPIAGIDQPNNPDAPDLDLDFM
jgi:hypothetical protein